MKKMFFIMISCLLLVGCGSKKVNNKPEKEAITLELGSEDMTFKEEAITCGNYEVQSTITFNSNGQASYEFYSCNDDNINLETSEGSYETDDLDVTLTNSYEEQLSFEITDNNTIVLKDGTDNIRTFTK